LFENNSDDFDCVITGLNMPSSGLTEEETKETHGGMFAGWVWLKNYIIDKNVKIDKIILSGYIESFKHNVLADQKSPYEDIYLIDKADAGMVEKLIAILKTLGDTAEKTIISPVDTDTVTQEIIKPNAAKKHNNSKLPTVFISYNWKQSDFAAKIANELKDTADVVYDKNQLGAFADITSFMGLIRQQDFAIMLISDEYLKSMNCMYEVSQLMKNENWNDKVMFAVFDSNFYSDSVINRYITYWQQKQRGIENFVSKSNSTNIDGELQKIEEIQSVMPLFLAKIKNTLNPPLNEFIPSVKNRLNEITIQELKDDLYSRQQKG